MAATISHDFAEVNGIRMHYAHAGNGKLMLFAHGFPEYWACWKGLLPEFAKDFHAVAPDMRGYNLTSRPQEVDAYKIGTLVDDLGALARHLGHEKFTLVAIPVLSGALLRITPSTSTSKLSGTLPVHTESP